jgi:hypothetical protein
MFFAAAAADAVRHGPCAEASSWAKAAYAYMFKGINISTQA